MMDTIFAWLLTYWLHSTIVLALMWLASRFLRERNLALEEAGWKAALFVTLLTSTLQLGLAGAVEYRPLAGALELRAAAGTPEPVAVRVPERKGGSLEVTTGAADDEARTAATVLLKPAAPAVEGSGVRSLVAFSRGRALTAVFILWLVGTSILVTRFVVSYLLLLSHLKDRRELQGGPHVALLQRLRMSAGVIRSVGLSVCATLAVPLALGLRRWEVCLPSKVTEEFDAEEQETVLAHELAHLVRYDTLWLLAARTLAGGFFFQPLNFVAVSRLRALCELRCDDWAVARTGRPVTLAKCLTRVASWRSNRWGGFPVPAMASSSRSQFGARVRRLVARNYPLPQGRVPRWLKISAVPLVLVFVAAAPGVVEHSRPEAAPEGAGTVAEAHSQPQHAPQIPGAPKSPKAAPAERAAISRAPLAPTVALGVVMAPPVAPASPRTDLAPIEAAPAIPRPPALPMAIRSAAPLAARAMPPVVPLSTARFARLDASGSFVGSDEAPEGQDEPGDRHAKAERGGAAEHHDDDDHDAYEDELDATEDALDADLEALEEVLEVLEERLEVQLRDRNLSEEQLESLETTRERMEENLSRFEELQDRELERIARRFERTVEGLWEREFERKIERAVEAQERTLERRIESAVRQMELASRRLETAKNAGERAQLDAEIQEKVRLMLPSEEDLAEIRANVERVRAELAPRLQEFEGLEVELRQALEEWQARYGTELEKLREKNQEVIREID